MKTLAFLLLITGCAHSIIKSKPREEKTPYSYVDASGTFKLVREAKQVKNKIVTRNQMFDSKGGNLRVVEKSIMVSDLGSIKSKNTRLITVRPAASEFVVWLEGKKYTSRMKIDTKRRSMVVELESQEEKWPKTSLIKFPRSKYFCFFNQIPECLYHNNFLDNAHKIENQKFEFYIIWDNFPFIQDQLTGVGRNLFSPAAIKFDGEIKGLFRYIVEVEDQMISYFFTKSFDLVKIAWVGQGITIAPPGQEIVEDE